MTQATEDVLDALVAEPGTYRILSESYLRRLETCWLELRGSDASLCDMKRRLAPLMRGGDSLPSTFVQLEGVSTNAQELRALLDQLLGPLHQRAP